MRKILVVVSLVFFGISAQAQDIPLIDLGLRGGVNGSFLRNLNEDNFDGDGMLIGYAGGAWARVNIPLVGLFVQPELLVTRNGGKFASVGGTDVVETQISQTTLDIPLLLGKRFSLVAIGVRGYIGPVMSNILDAKSETTDPTNGTTEADITDNVESPQFGGIIGAGIDISRLSIDLRYQHNFTGLSGDSIFEDDLRVSLLQLSLGLKLL